MTSEIKVLDHGFVRLVDKMGDDSAIVQAARVSYGSGTKSIREDEGLIRYLMRHMHTTPFEMCEIKLHCKMPIFVARQWIRHRTANVNEYSARYSILDREFYIPEPEQLARQSSVNNQGRGDLLSVDEADLYRKTVTLRCDSAFDLYETLADDTEGNPGLARELARIHLPMNTYTQWYWKVDLHNLFHFLKLRMDPHAQWEIREYANSIATIVKGWVPMAYHAFEDYQLNAFTMSHQMLMALRIIIRGGIPDYKQLGMSKREIDEFEEVLGYDR